MHFRFRCQKMNGLVEPNIKFKKCKSEKSKNFISGRWRVHPKPFGWTTPCALHSYPSLHYIWVGPHCHHESWHDAHYLSLLGRCSTNQKVLSFLVNATSSVAHIVSSEYKNLFYILCTPHNLCHKSQLWYKIRFLAFRPNNLVLSQFDSGFSWYLEFLETLPRVW